MPNTRRSFLKTTFALGTLALLSSKVFGKAGAAAPTATWPGALFESSTIDRAIARYTGETLLVVSEDVQIKAPRVAENGAVVPVTVTGKRGDIESIAIFVENNPVPLVGEFHFSVDTEPFVSTRIKMATTGDIVVVAKRKDTYLSARQTVKVTIGGCGG